MRAVTFQEPGRVEVRRQARARAARRRRRDRPRQRDRRLRLGPAHLPRARADRAGLHDRPRVRRRGRRRGRRRHERRGRRPRARLLPGRLRRRAASAAAATSTSATRSRTFGHGAALGDLQGTQAELALVPHANLTLRRVPDGLSTDVALFAGDVMGTGYHATVDAGVRPGDTVAVLGLGPVGLCAVQAALLAGAAQVIAIDTVAERLEMARAFGAQAVHLTEEDPRAAVKARDRGPRRRRRDRRRRRPARARARDPPDAQVRHGQRRRRLRRARRGPHGPGLDQGAEHQHRPRQRDRATSTRCSSCSRPAGSTRRRWSPITCRSPTRPRPTRSTTAREALKIVLTPMSADALPTSSHATVRRRSRPARTAC